MGALDFLLGRRPRKKSPTYGKDIDLDDAARKQNIQKAIASGYSTIRDLAKPKPGTPAPMSPEEAGQRLRDVMRKFGKK